MPPPVSLTDSSTCSLRQFEQVQTIAVRDLEALAPLRIFSHFVFKRAKDER
jgi:hypothetical protein